MGNFVKEVIVTLIVAIVIFLLLRLTVGSYTVVNISMQPGLTEGQRILVSKLVYRFGDPQRGDVVVFQSPIDDLTLVKRIIGLPGDSVEVKQNDAVYVDGMKLSEPYLKEPAGYSYPLIKVPPNNYFVLGDNRNASSDSHSGWTVPRENIVGRGWIFTWPPSKWGSLPNYPLNRKLTPPVTP